MKFFFYLLLALFTVTASAQNLEVEYLHVATQTGQKVVAPRTLLLRGEQSLLLQHLPEQDKPSVQEVNNADGSLGYKVNFKVDDNTFSFIDRRTGELTTHVPLFGESILIKEPVIQIDWSMTGETKVVAEHTCHEAIGTFRGRTYSAWFALDIPISAGPFKFTGLPGLILEIADEDGEFSWHCKSIRPLPPTKEQLIKEPTKGKEVSLPEFYKLIETVMDRRFKAMETNSDLTVNGDFKLDRENLLERTN